MAVGIINFNGARYLKDCLESVHAQTERSAELVVVDNGSTDDSIPTLRRGSGGVRPIESPRYAGASPPCSSSASASIPT